MKINLTKKPMKGKYQKLIIIGIIAVFFLVAFGNSMFIKLEATERFYLKAKIKKAIFMVLPKTM